MSKDKDLELRPYRPQDCPEPIELFQNTVRTINARDYSPEQREAWISNPDPWKWNQSFLQHRSIVAWKNHEIAGFADLDEKQNLLDHLFVAADHQKEGIASALSDILESACNGAVIHTEASITARPFFESRGYRVIREQQVLRKGVSLTNYLMEKMTEDHSE